MSLQALQFCKAYMLHEGSVLWCGANTGKYKWSKRMLVHLVSRCHLYRCFIVVRFVYRNEKNKRRAEKEIGFLIQMEGCNPRHKIRGLNSKEVGGPSTPKQALWSSDATVASVTNRVCSSTRCCGCPSEIAAVAAVTVWCRCFGGSAEIAPS